MVYPFATDVVREALAVLGQTDLPETVDTADTDPKRRVFATLYESARKRVLLAHPWNFLRCVSPTASGELGRTREGRPLYMTPLPGDCLRLLGARDENGEAVAHRRIGQELHSESPLAVLEYLRDEPDPERWDPWVRKALVCRLAADYARPLKGSMMERDLQEKAYQEALQEATKVNALEDASVRRHRYAKDVLDGSYARCHHRLYED